MVIGDSIQAGTNLHRVTDQATERVQHSGRIMVHNFASPGARMTDISFFAGMNQAIPAVNLLDGFVGMYGIVINLGTNDWSSGTWCGS
jgi:hypothetical protein